MGKIERLALEVNYIEVTGSAHEGVFGEPRNLEDNEDVRLWTTGLREDGGGGYESSVLSLSLLQLIDGAHLNSQKCPKASQTREGA